MVGSGRYWLWRCIYLRYGSFYGMRLADAMLHASKIAGYACSKGGAMPEIPSEHQLVVHNDKKNTMDSDPA